MKTQHLVLILVVAAVGVGAYFFIFRRKGESVSPTTEVGAALPPKPVLAAPPNVKRSPSKTDLVRSGVTLAAAGSCVALASPGLVPLCGKAAPLAANILTSGGKGVVQGAKATVKTAKKVGGSIVSGIKSIF